MKLNNFLFGGKSKRLMGLPLPTKLERRWIVITQNNQIIEENY